MNSKTCKFLRNVTRINFGSEKEVMYAPSQPPQFKEIQIPQKHGVPLAMMVKVARGIPRRLDNCGRKTYKMLKASY